MLVFRGVFGKRTDAGLCPLIMGQGFGPRNPKSDILVTGQPTHPSETRVSYGLNKGNQ